MNYKDSSIKQGNMARIIEDQINNMNQIIVQIDNRFFGLAYMTDFGGRQFINNICKKDNNIIHDKKALVRIVVWAAVVDGRNEV
jgi:hypothetical protein